MAGKQRMRTLRRSEDEGDSMAETGHAPQLGPVEEPDMRSSQKGGHMTNRRMFFSMLFGAVFRRRSRALMAVIASAVGAATLFCLVSVCIMVPKQMAQDMRSYGANLIVTSVHADEDGASHRSSNAMQSGGHGAQTESSGADQSPSEQAQDSTRQREAKGIDADQVLAVGRKVRRVAPAQSASYRYETMRINSTPYTIAGIDPAQVRSLNRHWEVEGKWPTDGNLMIGQNLAQTLGAQIGTVITITYKTGDAPKTGAGTWSMPKENKIQYRIGGIVSTGGNEDDIVYATAADVDQLTGVRRGADVVEFSSQATGDSLAALTEAVNRDAGLDLKAQQVTQITSADTRITTMLRTLFWIVSLVVLALMLVGVGTTISSIVSQRRNEIGLRKALGASSRSIGVEFFAESALYGLFGGFLGTAIGYGFARWLSVSVFDHAIGFSWPLGIGSVAFTMMVAVLASIPPVGRATRIEPAVVLSEE
ncbi:ABC transporter, permease protein [Bifidobacterium bombi DSM 19703]|uniref:ABC transporter, permease protein n=2 Tax=Bifidobacterium bombi TaxID=471511 RepID=A0A086BP84_9BIFI|nr:ABC transporter, permease protein [Bifidobacterium bombi DSM 19703]